MTNDQENSTTVVVPRLTPVLRRRPVFGPCLCLLVCLAGSISAGAAEASPNRPWSAELLDAVAQERGTVPQKRPLQGVEGGVVLKSYQLRSVRVGVGGRSHTLLATMERLLPPGSSVETDIPANTLHILTTPEAHAAVWEFLSAVDLPVPLPTTDTSASVVALSDKLQKALERLAASAKRSDELTEALSSLRLDLARPRVNEPVRRLGDWRLQGGVTAAVLAFVGFVLVRRLGRRRPDPSINAASSAPIIPADQIALALAPAHQRMQQEMMGVLNAAAIRMESWYNEQASQREQLEQAVSAVGARVIAESEARLQRVEARFENSATRIEANVRELSVQNDRVEALAGELATTVRELDLTKDQILRLQSDLEHKGQALDTTREKLSMRDHELARQQAKLAALTLILEEGGSFAAPVDAAGVAAARAGEAPNPPLSCTIPQAPNPTTSASQAPTAPYPFRFLPPDHPET